VETLRESLYTVSTSSKAQKATSVPGEKVLSVWSATKAESAGALNLAINHEAEASATVLT